MLKLKLEITIKLQNKLCRNRFSLQTAKTERKAAKKQIKYAEKKIKNLDTAKKRIRKNFERKINL